jgi:anti-sigma factor RsiW
MAGDEHLMTGVYAVDAFLDDDERRSVEAHLGSCDHCREEARSLREAAALLTADGAVPAPVGLHDRVFAQIARTPQEPPLPSAAPPSTPAAEHAQHSEPIDLGQARATRRGPAAGPGRVARWSAAAAAVLVLGGGGLAAYGKVQLDQAHQAQAQAGRLRSDADRTLAIVADPAARRATVQASGGGTATLVSAGSQAVLLAADLPALAAGRAYQLWVVRPNQVLSAGMAPAESPAGHAWNHVVSGLGSGDAVAISVEPAGGSAQPTTTPVAVIKV